MKRARQWGRGSLLTAGALLTDYTMAYARLQGGGGSSRIPGTDFLIELYGVTNNVWIPTILIVALAAILFNMAFSFVRIGPGIGKILLIAAVASLGLTWFINTVGGNLAVAMLW